MSDEAQSGTATIARLACTYALPRAGAAVQPLRWRLDQVLEGRLGGFEAGRVRLQMDEGGLRELELSNISKAKLIVEL